jgi:hypothetical protein
MPSNKDFVVVFEQLKGILQKHASKLVVTQDASEGYSLDCQTLGPNGKPLFFGSAQVKKNYVSYYLMPVYMYPDLLDDASPELRKRMQGKSCFNFKSADKALFKELEQLTKKSMERLRTEQVL